MLGVIVYKLLVYRPLSRNKFTQSRALQIANVSGTLCNLICIMILSRVSDGLGIYLLVLAKKINFETLDLFINYKVQNLYSYMNINFVQVYEKVALALTHWGE